MKKLKTYIKELKKSNNLLKVISLSLGLSILLVLFSKISFNLDYNSFYPDTDRLYMLYEVGGSSDSAEDTFDYDQVSGGVTLLLKREIPAIEVATRYTYISRGHIYDESRNKYKAAVICADTCLFDLLPRPMIQGNAKETLAKPMHILVSRSFGEKIGTDIIGKKLELDTHPGKYLTIDGIFEDIPKNASNVYDIIVGMGSIGNFMSDGSKNLLGNDRYKGYVKLQKGITPASLADAIYEAQVKFQNIKEVEKRGTKMTYKLESLGKPMKLHPDLKRNVLLLSILAFTLLFVSMSNYILATLSTLIDKANNIAVRKCFGASNTNIYKQLATETLFHILIALGIAGILIFCSRGVIEYILEVNINDLFGAKACLYLFLILTSIFIVITTIPSFIFSKVPTISILNAYKGNKGYWKRILLSIQFIAAIFLTTLVVIIMLQYNKMTKENHGFNPENLIYSFVPRDSKNILVEKLKQQPFIEIIAQASYLPAAGQGPSGNNVILPDSDKELFNITDFYGVDDHFIPAMEIKIKSGKNFTPKNTKSDILVSEMFEERMKAHGWTNGAVGKEVVITEHGLCKIVGVYKEVKATTTTNAWYNKPSLFFYNADVTNYLVIRLNKLTGENIMNVQKIIKDVIPDKEIDIRIYNESLISQYDDENKFKDSVLLTSIFTILITIIGLVIYLNNEIQRRRFEIAVRRVNGASLLDIISIFTKEIFMIFTPMAILASIGAYYAANKWMEDFVLKIDMHYGIFIFCSAVILFVTLVITLINCSKISNDNPIDSLKPRNS